ncbi:MAG: hypothetical protein MJ053_01035 [Elusimicrobiaceae bacterium]|nr:hypothetical protein [Elusimicrobiaceae bacterium]
MRLFMLFIISLGLGACAGAHKGPLVGADRDAHGCIGSAGYVWSEPLQQCVRPWEVGK